MAGVIDRLFGWARPKRTARTASPRQEDTAALPDTGYFLRAMCDVSPDFERYARLDEEGARAALGAVYVGLPQIGKTSRAAVLRRFLALKATDAGETEEAKILSGLSDNATLHVARRTKHPI
jgi:hypothetical protein